MAEVFDGICGYYAPLKRQEFIETYVGPQVPYDLCVNNPISGVVMLATHLTSLVLSIYCMGGQPKLILFIEHAVKTLKSLKKVKLIIRNAHTIYHGEKSDQSFFGGTVQLSCVGMLPPLINCQTLLEDLQKFWPMRIMRKLLNLSFGFGKQVEGRLSISLRSF
jgi:hypothetical protein